MHHNAAAIDQLVSLVYQSAIDLDAESRFLEVACSELKLASACVVAIDITQRTSRMTALYVRTPSMSVAAQRALMREYNRHFSSYNPLTEIAIDKGLLVAGGTVYVEDLVPHPLLEKTAMHSNLFQPQGWDDHAGIVTMADDRRALTVSFALSEDSSPITEDLKAVLQILAGHLPRAHKLRQTLENRRLMRDAALQSLDSLTFGMIIIDETSKVVFCNQAAHSALENSSALSLRNAEMHCGLARSQKLLQQHIAMAIDSAQHGLDVHWTPVELDLPGNGGRSTIICAYPLRLTRSADAQPQPACVLYLREPESEISDSLDNLIALFKLTPAEASVALAISRGESLEQIAATMAHSVATSRTLLKRVYAKTGTNRQNELARLLLSLTALSSRQD
tara:strand:- start:6937 stop:8115 length:1179 start_codon:yes stop_codon:yes gene_type:complete